MLSCTFLSGARRRACRDPIGERSSRQRVPGSTRAGGGTRRDGAVRSRSRGRSSGSRPTPAESLQRERLFRGREGGPCATDGDSMRSAWQPLVAGAVVLAVVVGLVVWHGRARKEWNVLLVTVDTL